MLLASTTQAFKSFMDGIRDTDAPKSAKMSDLLYMTWRNGMRYGVTKVMRPEA